MTQKIALLRGVNVGGNNKLPMKALTTLLEDNGCRNVRTYIQSGNIIFNGKLTGEDIASLIEQHFGFSPQTFVITAAKLKKFAKECPYLAHAHEDPKSVHVFFFEGEADENAERALNEIKTAPEEFKISRGVMYLHSPRGLSASKIGEKADRLLKTTTTARNWNTIQALVDLTDTVK